jgi:hypothetical protein
MMMMMNGCNAVDDRVGQREQKVAYVSLRIPTRGDKKKGKWLLIDSDE